MTTGSAKSIPLTPDKHDVQLLVNFLKGTDRSNRTRIVAIKADILKMIKRNENSLRQPVLSSSNRVFTSRDIVPDIIQSRYNHIVNELTKLIGDLVNTIKTDVATRDHFAGHESAEIKLLVAEALSLRLTSGYDSKPSQSRKNKVGDDDKIIANILVFLVNGYSMVPLDIRNDSSSHLGLVETFLASEDLRKMSDDTRCVHAEELKEDSLITSKRMKYTKKLLQTNALNPELVIYYAVQYAKMQFHLRNNPDALASARSKLRLASELISKHLSHRSDRVHQAIYTLLHEDYLTEKWCIKNKDDYLDLVYEFFGGNKPFPKRHDDLSLIKSNVRLKINPLLQVYRLAFYHQRSKGRINRIKQWCDRSDSTLFKLVKILIETQPVLNDVSRVLQDIKLYICRNDAKRLRIFDTLLRMNLLTEKNFNQIMKVPEQHTSKLSEYVGTLSSRGLLTDRTFNVLVNDFSNADTFVSNLVHLKDRLDNKLEAYTDSLRGSSPRFTDEHLTRLGDMADSLYSQLLSMEPGILPHDIIMMILGQFDKKYMLNRERAEFKCINPKLSIMAALITISNRELTTRLANDQLDLQMLKETYDTNLLRLSANSLMLDVIGHSASRIPKYREMNSIRQQLASNDRSISKVLTDFIRKSLEHRRSYSGGETHAATQLLKLINKESKYQAVKVAMGFKKEQTVSFHNLEMSVDNSAADDGSDHSLLTR